MSFRKASFALFTGLALVAAGCGGDDEPADQGTATQPAGAETTAGEPTGADTAPPADSGEVTELGSFTVDGVVFAVRTLNRCEPFGGGDAIDQQALAQGAKINLVVGNNVDVSVDGTALDEAYGSNAFGRDVVVHDSSADGGRLTGSATIADSRGSGTTIEVEWDVQLSDEIRDCSL